MVRLQNSFSDVFRMGGSAPLHEKQLELRSEAVIQKGA